MPNTTSQVTVRRFLRSFKRILRLVLLVLEVLKKLLDLFQ